MTLPIRRAEVGSSEYRGYSGKGAPADELGSWGLL
jgi:hypothetical protein